MILMYGVEPVAKVIINSAGVQIIKLATDDLITALPSNVFTGQMTYKKFNEWLTDRVAPEGRYGIKEIMESIGEDRYIPMALIRRTHGSLMDDRFWIKFNDDDDFYRDTLRGRAEKSGLMRGWRSKDKED